MNAHCNFCNSQNNLIVGHANFLITAIFNMLEPVRK